jgi:hypothetical protein
MISLVVIFSGEVNQCNSIDKHKDLGVTISGKISKILSTLKSRNWECRMHIFLSSFLKKV